MRPSLFKDLSDTGANATETAKADRKANTA